MEQIEEPKAVEETPVKPVNPLLSRVHMPGSTFTLPSGGLFYKNDELADSVTGGDVHIHPMTAYDEILLKSPDLLFSGDAVTKVFNRCIPEILKPLELFGKDVDFLMICLRKMTYGDTFDLTYTHTCKNAKKREYVINIDKFINTTKRINPTTIGKLFSTKTKSGQVVNMHPPRFKDVIKMIQAYDPNLKLTPEEEENETMETIISVISDVDSITNKEHIKEWLKTLSAGVIADLSKSIEATTNWGPDFIVKPKCKDCKKELEIVAPLNPLAFFI